MGRRPLKVGGTLLALFTTLLVVGQSAPKMVVGITVDQMRAEYLSRFNDHFEGGFRRLLDEGAVYRNCHYSHTPTYTAPGHATIYTGAQPRDHGIIGNDWYDPRSKTSVYCVEDSTEFTAGAERDDAGQRSPRNLLTTTWTDQLHLATMGRSFIGAVSIKDRGAILPGGHRGDEVYWFNSKTGQFITSTYYTEDTPDWVDKFNTNHRDLADYASVWTRLKEDDTYINCMPDDNDYETTFGREASTLPLDIPALIQDRGPGMIANSPDGNRLVTDFALNMLENISEEQMSDDATDVLAISYSSPDYIGHAFGPRSVEVMDTYLRLDLELERLFAALDEKLGRGNYIVFLTADHGVAENPNFMHDELRMSATNHSGSDLLTEMISKAETALGFNPIERFDNDALHFDEVACREAGYSNVEVAEVMSAILLELNGIKAVWTPEEIMHSDVYQAQLRRQLLEVRAADMYIEWFEGHYLYGRVGASHGSGYTYDTHVPMILMGADVPSGEIYRKVHVIDLAPTVAHMLKIAIPNAAFGEILEEVLPFIEH